MKNKYILYILLFLVSFNSFSQYSSVGTEFNFAFIQNRIDRNGAETNCLLDNYINIYISVANNSDDSANIKVNFNGAPVYYKVDGTTYTPTSGNEITFNLTGNSSSVIEIYPFDSLTYTNVCNEYIDLYDPRVFQAMNNCQVQNKTITIISTNEIPITVFAENSQSNSRDVSMILPNTALGTIYYAFSTFPNPLEYPTQHYGQNLSGPSEALILAIYDNTNVIIKMPENVSNTTHLYSNVDAYGIDSMVGNTQYYITLNAGEVFQMQSDNFSLSGTYFSSSKAFAVFSGNMANKFDCTGTCGNDYIYEQMLPMKNWGTKYIITPLHDNKPEGIKIISMFDNNNVSINGTNITLNQGIEYDTTLNENETMYISAASPICIAQITSSSLYDGNNHTANDPSMVILTPLSQPIEGINLSVPIKLPASNPSACDNVSKIDYINIVALTNNIDSIYINDFVNPFSKLSDYPNLVTNWINIPSNTDYSYCIVDVTNPSTTNSKPIKLIDISTQKSGFNAIVSGFDCAEGYSFNAGILVPDTITGLKQINEHEINIYPNPFNDKLTIKTDEKAKIEIYTTLGQLVLVEYITNEAIINTEQLKKGVYLVKISQNNSSFFKTIIKLDNNKGTSEN